MSSLSESLQRLKDDLIAAGQGHLFSKADGALVLSRLQELHAFQYPGGILTYIANAKRLLTSANSGSEYISVTQPPLVFSAPPLCERSDELMKLEEEGMLLLPKTVFVLVAGGLGERLGYSGIKISLPVDTASGASYLHHFVESFVLFRRRQRTHGSVVPSLVIMTSDDTHARTLDALAALLPAYPALQLGADIICVKQETVFCLADNEARLAVDANSGALLRKPHGHGDVHALLASATVRADDIERRLVDVWREGGVQYVVFCQDTNATSTWTAPVSLAVCEREALDMGFTCVPRVPQEAVGLLCHVQMAADSAKVSRTVNIEYNKFDPVYRALYGKGDVPAEGSLYSPFPGSINTLVVRFERYADILAQSGGAVPEFINPKYTDATKTSFKTPTRVESLMQDVALLYDPASAERHRVGGILFERHTYHPVKNSMTEALSKVRVGGDAHCAATGETSMYALQRRRLLALGVQLEEVEGAPAPFVVAPELSVQLFPIVSFDSMFHCCCMLSRLAARFKDPSAVFVTARSALVVRGNVVVESLRLDGALVIEGPEDNDASPLVVSGLVVENAGWVLKDCRKDSAACEVDRMRGYRLHRRETTVVDGRVNSAAPDIRCIASDTPVQLAAQSARL